MLQLLTVDATELTNTPLVLPRSSISRRAPVDRQPGVLAAHEVREDLDVAMRAAADRHRLFVSAYCLGASLVRQTSAGVMTSVAGRVAGACPRLRASSRHSGRELHRAASLQGAEALLELLLQRRDPASRASSARSLSLSALQPRDVPRGCCRARARASPSWRRTLLELARRCPEPLLAVAKLARAAPRLAGACARLRLRAAHGLDGRRDGVDGVGQRSAARRSRRSAGDGDHRRAGRGARAGVRRRRLARFGAASVGDCRRVVGASRRVASRRSRSSASTRRAVVDELGAQCIGARRLALGRTLGRRCRLARCASSRSELADSGGGATVLATRARPTRRDDLRCTP